MQKIKSFFFFFQAEDGIRDSSVTGVQTCALPIFTRELGTNPEPVTVRLTSGPESSPFEGEIEPMIGTGVTGSTGGGLCQSRDVPFPVASASPILHMEPLVGED